MIFTGFLFSQARKKSISGKIRLEGITALLINGNIAAIELPVSITFTIEETPPSIKGASAANRTKTARLNTGLEIQVPEYLERDDMIKVNTLTGKFMSRA